MLLACDLVSPITRRSSTVKIAGLAILATLGLAAGQANATPITYSITGNGIYDNPVGSFTYNAATGRYSNVSIWSLDYYGSASGSANSLSVDRLDSWVAGLA